MKDAPAHWSVFLPTDRIYFAEKHRRFFYFSTFASQNVRYGDFSAFSASSEFSKVQAIINNIFPKYENSDQSTRSNLFVLIVAQFFSLSACYTDILHLKMEWRGSNPQERWCRHRYLQAWLFVAADNKRLAVTQRPASPGSKTWWSRLRTLCL